MSLFLFLFRVALMILMLFANNIKAEPGVQGQSQDISGKPFEIADYKGKIVILDFWATWCPPCREEIPHFVELQNEYGKHGLVIIGVCLDETGLPGVVTFASRQKINYRIVMATRAILDKYGESVVLPTTFVIDRRGNIAFKHEGATDASVLESEIAKLLGSSRRT